MKKIIFTSYILVSAMVLAQRPNPAPAQKNPIAITNATIHTATVALVAEISTNPNVLFTKIKPG